jgi:chromosomal replication initiator protein
MSLFWTDCLARFESELPAQQFNAWIKSLRVESDEDGRHLRLFAPNGFILKWVRERYLDRIEILSRQFFKEPVTIDLILDETPSNPVQHIVIDGPVGIGAAGGITAGNSPALSGEEIFSIESAGLPEDSPDYDKTRLNPEFTFDTLVTGRSNDLARAAAQQVAINPGSSYNPLFIYGGVGLGKTHLVHALGNEVLRHAPDKVIRYIHAEDYYSDVVRAFQQKSFDIFKRTYRTMDVLLVDDIQFFNGKARTQEEFFYVFNALVEAKKQIVITCDTYPKDIQGLEERLISRFDWGLTVQIEPPELEMRVAILKKKADSEAIALGDDVAFLIAKHLRSNVRELEGALKKVLAFSRFHNRPITLELAKEALKDIIGAHNRQITLELIQKTVADYYKIKVADMFSQRRTRAVARPRQVAMWLARDLTPHSLPEIGDAFGGRDHTTVLHACRTIVDLRTKDNHLNNDILVLSQTIKG